MQKIIKKTINQNLISYKTIIRGYSKTNKDNKEVLIRQKEIIITEVKTTQKNVFLPDKINGFPIGDIGESAFENNDSIERVTLPKQLKNIRNHYMGLMVDIIYHIHSNKSHLFHSFK